MSTATAPGQAAPQMGMRDRWRRRVEPLARGFGRLGLTPNALTLIGFGVAVLAAWLATQQAWLAAGVAVIVGAVFDLFDGALARATSQASKFGAFLDSTMDRWGEAVVYVGIVIGAIGPKGIAQGVAVAAAAAMAAAFMVSYTRAKGESLGFTPGRGMASVGLAPREVRIVILTLGLVAAGNRPLEPVPPPGQVCIDVCSSPGAPILFGSLVLITVLATITTVQRIVHVNREARKQESQ